MTDKKPTEANAAFNPAASIPVEPTCPVIQGRVDEELKQPKRPFHDPEDILEPYDLN